MSVFTSVIEEEQYEAEQRLELHINSLNSMRDDSSNPAKVKNKIKQVISEVKFIRQEFPESDSCKLSNVMFAQDCADEFPELKEYL